MLQALSCASCQLLDQQTRNKCLLTGFRVDPLLEHCSKHSSSVSKCEICGKILIRQGVIIDGPHLLCDACNQQVNHCGTCQFSEHCFFNEDSTPPQQKFVQQQIRQGNTIMTQQVRSPSLVEKTCKKCKCFSRENNQCMRDFNGCGQYKFKEL